MGARKLVRRCYFSALQDLLKIQFRSLEALPFPDEEFDFVYVLTIALSRLFSYLKACCQAYQKDSSRSSGRQSRSLAFFFSPFVIAYYRAQWDALFDEISRVMKPGAAFEVRQSF